MPSLLREAVAVITALLFVGPVMATESIVRGEVHELDFEAGFVELEITSPEAELVVTASPAITARTSFSRRVSFAGPAHVTIRIDDGSLPAGRYTVQVLHSDGDQKHLAAQRAFLAGVDRLRDQSGASTREAIDRFREALSQWRALGDRWREAETLQALAFAHARLTKNREAIPFAEEALAIWRELGDRRGEAVALGTIGSAYEAVSELPKAKERFESALALHRAEGDRIGESRQLTGIGAVLQRMGKNKEALECLEMAHRIDRELDDRAGEVATLRWIGNAWLGTGDRRKALEISQQALDLARETGDRFQQGLLLNNIAVIHGYEGQWEKAIELFEEASAIYAEGGQQAEEANALLNIGTAWALLSDFRKAADFYERALPISRALGDRGREVALLVYLGSAYRELGDTAKAIPNLDAGLQMSRQLGLRRFEAIALNHYAMATYSAHRFEEALQFHEQLLPIVRETGNTRAEVNTLANIGATLGTLGRCGPSRARVLEALALARQTDDRTSEGPVLAGLARVDREDGQLTDAYEHVSAALEVAESLRATASVQQIRNAFLASVRDQYELQIDLLMELHRRWPAAGLDALALQASERARARGLVETLEEARAQIRQDADPALLAREQQVRKLLNEKAAAQTRVLSNRPKPAETAALGREIEDLTGQLHQIEGQIRESNPRYRSLVEPPALDLSEIQGLLDDDTVLLEYSLGEPRSYVWAVTRNSLRGYALPRRERINAVARRVHAGFGMRIRTKAADDAAAELSAMILAPVLPELRARVVIAAEGALQYVPFAALPVRSSTLTAHHEIVSIPSAATLAVLRRDRKEAAPEKTLIVFADPVFSTDDPRLTPSSRGNGTRGGGRRGLERMQRLPLSRLEADSIASLVSPASSRKALDFEASRATAAGDEMRRYRIVHFATHGVLNSDHPELSGVVLSLFDEKGRPQDGFMRLHDIYNLDLPAELVVLSACQTALGKDIKGEGLIGLTRGFMHAGAPRVVASLWKVDDRGTAELMKRFYQGMLGPRRLRPAAALRAAQREMAKTPMWSHPYYWAGFLLQGEWR